MAEFAISTGDPLGLGAIDGTTPINVTDLSIGERVENLEAMAGNSKWIENAVIQMKPHDELSITYELLAGASFSVGLGVAINTDWLITALTANMSTDTYPTISITAMKPSAANKIKPYIIGAVSFSLLGGLGIRNTFGASSSDCFTSSSVSISMLEADILEDTSGDFCIAGIYRYGFKEEVSVEAYDTITIPSDAHKIDNDAREGRDAWQTSAANFWTYLDSVPGP